jgi:hypothetical protein
VRVRHRGDLGRGVPREAGFDAIFAQIQERVGPSTTPIVQQKKIKLEGGGVLRGGGRDDGRAILKSETRSPTSTAPNTGSLSKAKPKSH